MRFLLISVFVFGLTGCYTVPGTSPGYRWSEPPTIVRAVDDYGNVRHDVPGYAIRDGVATPIDSYNNPIPGKPGYKRVR